MHLLFALPATALSNARICVMPSGSDCHALSAPTCDPAQAGAEAARRRVRAELMRWHPDKFGARFGPRLAARERAGVLERVKAVAQMLTELARAVAAEAAGA